MNEIEKIKESHNIVDIIGITVDLKKYSHYYMGLCPFHNDTKPTMAVYENNQHFKCFSCGAGGDIIDFYTNSGATLPEAIKQITDLSGVKIDPEKRKQIQSAHKKNTWKHIPNAHVPCTDFNHYEFGEPSKTWVYKSKSGGVNGYVCRFDLPDGSKQVIPKVYAENNGRQEWRWMGMQSPRELYAMDLLHKFPDSMVILVEGEKTADAVQEVFPPDFIIATTWVGGANGILATDFTPLNGRIIRAWPDNDWQFKYNNGDLKEWYEQPGMKAMISIMESIDSSDKKIINIDTTLPNKWDAADKEWDLESKEMLNFLKERMLPFDDILMRKNRDIQHAKQLKETQKNKPKKSDPEPPKKNDEPNDFNIVENQHYRFLGYKKNDTGALVYSFYVFKAKMMMTFTASQMNKSNLLQVAPLNYWERTFPGQGKSKLNIEQAQEYLVNTSYGVGAFKEDNIRGRGAWIDDDEIVIHNGPALINGGKFHDLHNFESKFVYEIGTSLGFKLKSKLKNNDSHEFIEKLKFFQWERKINSYFLAGWCVIAPFCGALPWRPHIWITGASGTGKSWMMENVVRRSLGKSGIVVQGNTTEAGLRGILQSDALPIAFDESEAETQSDKDRMQKVIQLARSSSHRDSGFIAKGSADGKSRTYETKSCFAMSSISVELTHRSDKSRFSVLGLKKFEGSQSKNDWKKFVKQWDSVFTKDFFTELHARTIELLPVILKNSKVFSQAASEIVGNKRIGDQIGSMLAGAYSLSSKSEISYEKALEWLHDKDLTEERYMEETKDEHKLFSQIMNTPIKVEGEYRDLTRTIGELIILAAGLSSEGYGMPMSKADEALRRFGILVRDNRFVIANGSKPLKNAIRDNPHSTSYSKILERIEGSQKENPTYFAPGVTLRGVSFPISMLKEDGSVENLADEILDVD